LEVDWDLQNATLAQDSFLSRSVLSASQGILEEIALPLCRPGDMSSLSLGNTKVFACESICLPYPSVDSYP
jgi:hypothetical protein